MADEQPQQRPEGRLLADALKADGRSANKAAAEAGISGTRWRHIVNGYQPVGGGQFVTVVGPGDTIARMAKVVGVTPEQLEEAGRGDAAAELRSMRATEQRLGLFVSTEHARAALVQRILEASQVIEEAAEQLRVLEGLPSRSATAHPPRAGGVTPLPQAAYRPGRPSLRERLDAAQDEAAETPDAPGTDDGA